jgi:hypothetical protein
MSGLARLYNIKPDEAILVQDVIIGYFSSG